MLVPRHVCCQISETQLEWTWRKTKGHNANTGTVGFVPSIVKNIDMSKDTSVRDRAVLPDPAKADGDVVLRDGSTVRVRMMRPGDEPGLLGLLQSLSEESRWLRFFSPAKGSALAAEAHREANLDHTFGLIALSGAEERVVGHAFYAGLDQNRAEVAFTIANDFQGRGLGTILLGQLAEVAAANGIQVFEAEVVASNHAMLHVFRESGFPIEVSAAAGQLHVTFPTAFTREAIERFEHREAIAAVNALKLFFNPRAVAVVGASRKRGTIGGEIFHNLLSYGFQGPVYPVNPTAEVVQSVPAYASVEAIPGRSIWPSSWCRRRT